jgi:3-phosphoshikimate 1-carboxyvinyltransferase
MSEITIKGRGIGPHDAGVAPLKGEINPPPDKSISHRAIFFSALAEGDSVIRNFLRAADPISTINAFRAMGVSIEERSDEIIVHGKGLGGLREPSNVIDCGNSGTTMRLLSGVLSGCPFFSVLTGDDSLRQRPMQRVAVPLRQMGARIFGRQDGKFAPLAIGGVESGRRLNGISYKSPVSSAQVKSAILLAGMLADGVTVVEEPVKSRDHTERMLKAMGANIWSDGLKICITGNEKLHANNIIVPGDFSSASFFMAAALMVKNSDLVIRNVGINPTRTGLLDALKQMGASVKTENLREVSGEPVCDLVCRCTDGLKAITLGEAEIPAIIDEFPILVALASQAHGVTEIRGAQELRVKESDRISAMVSEMRQMGAEIEEYPDGVSIKGPTQLKGARVRSHGDHRIAMALAVAALTARGDTVIEEAECVDISFPGFFDELNRLRGFLS